MFILTDNADALLDTIRSRCIRLDMEALSREEIEQVLTGEGVSAWEAKECAGFARGNLGLAKELASGGLLREWKDETVKTLKNLGNLDAFEIYTLSTEMDREKGNRVLDMIYKWYRDMLMAKSGAESEGLYFENDKAVLKRQSEGISYEGLERILNRIHESILRLQAGVKPEAVFETLYLRIREEYR